MQAFNKIQVSDSNDNIVVKNGNEYKVSYQGEANNKPFINVEDGVLIVKSAKYRNHRRKRKCCVE